MDVWTCGESQLSGVGSKAILPLHLKLVQKGKAIEVFTSADGTKWGEALMSHSATFDATGRIGMFTCSGNGFVSATAVFDRVSVSD